MTNGDSGPEDRLSVLSALSRVLRDPGRLLVLLSEALSDDDAVRRLREEYSLTAPQAQAVLDAQFRTATRQRVAAVDAELDLVRRVLAVSWEPPLEVEAMVKSEQGIEIVIDGIEHRIAGETLTECLDRLVSLVRDKLARPQRRRVSVAIGIADGPSQILVDPIGVAQFLYDDEIEDR